MFLGVLVSLGCNVVAGLAVLAIALGLGLPIAARIAPRTTPALQLSLALLVGATLTAHAVLGAGLLGWLRPLPLLAILAILAIPLAVGRRRVWERLGELAADLRSTWRDASRYDRALLLLTLILTAASLPIPLLPVTNADALAYGTAVPARFVLDGRMQFYPDSYESAMVLVVENLHVLGYGLHLRPLGVWLEIAAQLLLLFAVADAYAIFTGTANRVSAYLAAATLMILPLTQAMPFMNKAHLTELLAAVVCFALVLEAPEKGGWLGAAACAGVALALKYSALIGILALVAPAAVLSLVRQPRMLSARDLAGMVLIVAVLALPPYLRNFVWTGNPVFPIRIPFFHSVYELYQHVIWVRSVTTDAGYGRTLSALALLWPRAATIPVHGITSFMGPFCLVFLPLSLLGSPRPRHLLAAWLGFAAATVTLFLTTGQFERYFLAAIFPMSLLAAGGWLAQRKQHPLAFAMGYLLIMGIGIGLTLPLKAYGLSSQLPALLSRAGEERVLAQSTPYYDDLIHIRKLVPPSEPVLCMLRTCQYLPNSRREDLLFRLAEQNVDALGVDPRRGVARAARPGRAAHSARHARDPHRRSAPPDQPPRLARPL